MSSKGFSSGLPLTVLLVLGAYGLSFFTNARFEDRKKKRDHLERETEFKQNLDENVVEEVKKMLDSGIGKGSYENKRIGRPKGEETTSSLHPSPKRYADLEEIIDFKP